MSNTVIIAVVIGGLAILIMLIAHILDLLDTRWLERHPDSEILPPPNVRSQRYKPYTHYVDVEKIADKAREQV